MTRRMEEKGLSAADVAKELHVPEGEVEETIAGEMDAWRRAALFLLLKFS